MNVKLIVSVPDSVAGILCSSIGETTDSASGTRCSLWRIKLTLGSCFARCWNVSLLRSKKSALRCQMVQGARQRQEHRALTVLDCKSDYIVVARTARRLEGSFFWRGGVLNLSACKGRGRGAAGLRCYMCCNIN